MKFFKKCSCGAFYAMVDLPPFLKKPEGNQDPFHYFNCDVCHSTLVVRIDDLNDILAKVKRAS